MLRRSIIFTGAAALISASSIAEFASATDGSSALCADSDACDAEGQSSGLGLLQMVSKSTRNSAAAPANDRAGPGGAEMTPLQKMGAFLNKTVHDKMMRPGLDAKEHPTLVQEPFRCDEPLDMAALASRVATPDGHANVRSWCMSAEFENSIAKYCIQHPDLKKNAQLVFEQQKVAGVDHFDASYCFIEGHCDNQVVTENTTLSEAEDICDQHYGGRQSWTSVGLMSMPFGGMPTKQNFFSERSVPDWFGKLACAMGNFHCDVIYCRETYCKMEEYVTKYSYLRELRTQ